MRVVRFFRARVRSLSFRACVSFVFFRARSVRFFMMMRVYSRDRARSCFPSLCVLAGVRFFCARVRSIRDVDVLMMMRVYSREKSGVAAGAGNGKDI